MRESDLIYDWNPLDGGFDYCAARVELNDETLRDGLQSPSVSDPSMAGEAPPAPPDGRSRASPRPDIGLPGAGTRMVDQVRTLAWEIANTRLPDESQLRRPDAGQGHRTHRPDQPGDRPRHRSRDLHRLLPDQAVRGGLDPGSDARVSEEAVTFAVRQGLPVMYVTEDTTRARPETLKALYGNADSLGSPPALSR